jgi:uncharacterized membrane protein
MAAPSVNLKLLLEKLSKKIDRAAFSHSALFIVPLLATTFASWGLFLLLRGYTDSKLNSLSAILMAAVILSLLFTAGIQFVVYQVAGEASLSEDKMAARSSIRRAIILGIIFSITFSIAGSVLAYPYFKYVVGISTLEFSYFAILLILYSIIWVLTSAFWASGQYKSPALIFSFAYGVAFALSYLLYRLSSEYIICGFIAGIAVLLVLLSLTSWNAFKGQQEHRRLLESLLDTPKLMSKDRWGILFQTFFIIALFLDKIIIWVSQGMQQGSGLQIVGPYTTAAFLGLVPTVSVAALAYFAEKIKPLSKEMYKGTLHDIEIRVERYKSYYGRGLLTMLISGLILLVLSVGFSAYLIDDTKVVMIVLTIATGALFFQVILYNSFVLPIFGKSHISTVSVAVVCLAEALTALFVSNDIWYAALGFLAGSITGFLISHLSATRLLSEFHYNAFHAFHSTR